MRFSSSLVIVTAVAFVRTGRDSPLAGADFAADPARNPLPNAPACPCGDVSMEAQLVRQVQLSYSYINLSVPTNITTALTWTDSAGAAHDCYDFDKVPYSVPADATVGLGPWDLLRVPGGDSMDPNALLGKCRAKPKVCTMAFSGASNPSMLNSIPNWSPSYVDVKATGDGFAITDDESSPHGIHTGYWKIYQALREQIGERIHTHMQDCEEIYLSGHSIGGALASYWQWEQQQRYPFIFQIVVGNNLGWFPPVPDVQCRGLQIFQEDDPVPALRQTKDAHGNYNRHAAIVPTMIRFEKTTNHGFFGGLSALRYNMFGGELGGQPTDGTYTPAYGHCDSQTGMGSPVDPVQLRGGHGPLFTLHVLKRIFGQVSSEHLVIPYVKATAAAFHVAGAPGTATVAEDSATAEDTF